MPTYAFQCLLCGEGVEQWLSIHHKTEERPQTHECGGQLALVITGVRTYATGKRGEATRSADNFEKRLDIDRPAYKRLRAEGHQPRAVMDSHRLEAIATDDWFIKTGGMVRVPDDRKTEIDEMLAAGAMSDWSPIEEVHKRQGKPEKVEP